MRSNRAIISAAPEEPFILHCLSLSPSLWLEHTGARSLSTDLAAWRGSCVSSQQEKNHMEFLLLPVAGNAFKDAEGVCVCVWVSEREYTSVLLQGQSKNFNTNISFSTGVLKYKLAVNMHLLAYLCNSNTFDLIWFIINIMMPQTYTITMGLKSVCVSCHFHTIFIPHCTHGPL